jgi:AraC family transcriptional regulator of adaptative response / DNA-3-methyladenine glycosylase II
MDYQTTVSQLTETRGIGPWTAEYIAMRCLGWPDAFPHGDLVIKKSLGLSTKTELLSAVEKYRPWRAYAVMHIWKALEKEAPRQLVTSKS